MNYTGQRGTKKLDVLTLSITMPVDPCDSNAKGLSLLLLKSMGNLPLAWKQDTETPKSNISSTYCSGRREDNGFMIIKQDVNPI